MTEQSFGDTARERFGAYLRQRGKRQTSERFAILERVMGEKEHFTIEMFHEGLEGAGYHVSTGTVYNTFQLLCEAGLLRRHQFPGKSSEYEFVNPGANHTHLVCTECGRVREVKEGEELTAAVERRRYAGFRQAYYALYVYGICGRCVRRRNREK